MSRGGRCEKTPGGKAGSRTNYELSLRTNTCGLNTLNRLLNEFSNLEQLSLGQIVCIVVVHSKVKKEMPCFSKKKRVKAIITNMKFSI